MTNIRVLRTWKIKEDVFVGVLSSDFHGIKILKAVKTCSYLCFVISFYDINIIDLLLTIHTFLNILKQPGRCNWIPGQQF